FMPPKSPSNFESTQRPPGRTSLTSEPLETDGSASGPAMYVLIVASQAPSSAARILCSGSGFAAGGGSWAIAAPAMSHAARHDRTRARVRSDFRPARIGWDMVWAPCEGDPVRPGRMNRNRAGSGDWNDLSAGSQQAYSNFAGFGGS